MLDTIDTPAAGTARVTDAITAALGAVLERDLGRLDPGTQLFDELGLDSTGVLDLLLQLEELLECEIDTESLEMSHFATVESLAAFLTAELAA